MERQRLIDDIPVNIPANLEQTCINYVVKNSNRVLFSIIDRKPPRKKWILDHSTILPPIISDCLFSLLQKTKQLPTDTLLDVFSDTTKCLLQKCKLSDTEFNLSSLENLINSQVIREIEITNVTIVPNCNAVFKLSLRNLISFHFVLTSPLDKSDFDFDWEYHWISEKTHPNLRSLKLVGTSLSWFIMLDYNSPPLLTNLVLSENRSAPTKAKQKLKDIVDLGMVPTGSGDHNLNKLKYWMMESVSDLRNINNDQQVDETGHSLTFSHVLHQQQNALLKRYRLARMKNSLLSLSLYDTPFSNQDWDDILSLQKLKHLDISIATAMLRPNVTVWEIIESLPNLISLDVSNTDIGNRLYTDGISNEITGAKKLNHVPTRKLDFLGLCSTEGCEVINVNELASKVTGYASEYQTMFSIKYYMHRPSFLRVCIHEINRLQLGERISCPQKLIRLILETLDKYATNEKVVLTCTCSLDYLTREQYITLRTSQKNAILLALIRCLELHSDHYQIVRNSIISLYHFDAQNDFFVYYERVAKAMLNIFTKYHTQEDVNLMSVHFCNVIVCSVTRNIKKDVEKVLFVETILPIIKNRIENDQAGDILDVCWSIMWNVTDEMPQNSETLIKLGGLDLIQKCYEYFPTNIELLKNIMGLVGNIAEVKALRKHLMTEKLITSFCHFLTEDFGNIELAYNACGTLAHIISDGVETWTMSESRRDEIRKLMFERVESWSLETRRNINYRSFKPILRLTKCDVPECVHWAVWALCNLSMVDTIRYCRLLIEEDGVEILCEVKNRMCLHEKTRKLASIILRRINRFEHQSLDEFAENDVL